MVKRAWGKLSISVFVFITIISFTLPGERSVEVDKSLELFNNIFREVNSIYVEDIDPNSLIEAGIKSMLRSLDPYTSYIPQEKLDDFNSITSGETKGIGATIGVINGKNVILAPLEGHSAYNKGLRRGDEIVEIDGIAVTSKSNVSNLIKGQGQDEITMKVRRYGEEELIEKILKVEKIKIKNVPYYGKISDDVGYVKLAEFTSGAAEEVRKAVIQLKKQKAKKFILDLRDNPGGLLNEAVGVSNVFLPKGKVILNIKGKSPRWNRTYRTFNQPVDTISPLIIITNENSASAAEIVAGVMQDYDRGALIGQKTFGKGLVQATVPVGANTKLKITTAKFYIPSGRYIQAVDYVHAKKPEADDQVFYTKNNREMKNGTGIIPDILVEKKKIADLLKELESKGLIFDFASAYYFENSKKVIDPKKFRLSDKEYDEFLNWLDTQDFNYVTDMEKSLALFTNVSKNEKLYPHITDELESIRAKLDHAKSVRFDNFKEDIRLSLTAEIVARYHLTGKIESELEEDDHVKTAINMLKNTRRYLMTLNYSTNM
jgi:carboxyl-terminal processing protease